ncbi:MAG: response regulator [Mucilaginibacter sp.]|jgi:CheY-like chemotaxis protein|nr:response regulator [Mucilaginibacter sp.]
MQSDNILNNTNILVIDDEYVSNFICEKLIKKLKKESEIITCLNGKNAIDKLIEIKKQDVNLLPDYIFLDLSMPIVDGWEFLKLYSDLNIDPYGKCKIYILTYSLFKNDIIKSASYDIINDYIIKPLDLEKLKKVFI